MELIQDHPIIHSDSFLSFSTLHWAIFSNGSLPGDRLEGASADAVVDGLWDPERDRRGSSHLERAN